MQKCTVIFIGMILLFLGGSDSSSIELKICHYCSQMIERTYIKAERFFFHPDHLVCSGCNDPIAGQTYFFKRGKFYDNACYERLNRLDCDFCSGKIESEYVSYKKKKYHPECFEENVATRCDLCNKSIRGTVITDAWGRKYHSEHQGLSPRCDYCGTFLTSSGSRRGFQYEDGRKICLHCNTDAVSDDETALDVMKEVIEHLGGYDFHVSPGDVEIVLVNADSMRVLDKGTGHRKLGLTDYQARTNIWGRTLERKVTVYILSGIPRMLAISTIAHELMHVWRILNGQPGIDRVFNEGSCNYASLLVLQHYEGIDAELQIQSLLNDDSPVYGDGLRRVKQFVESEGMSAWADRLLSESSLPEER